MHMYIISMLIAPAYTWEDGVLLAESPEDAHDKFKAYVKRRGNVLTPGCTLVSVAISTVPDDAFLCLDSEVLYGVQQ